MTPPLHNPAVVFQITILPVYTGGDFRVAGSGILRNVLEAQPSLLLSRGAVAIRLALAAERIGTGDEVLVPAFHCPSMIAPVVAAGATPVFYGITEGLSVDLGSIKHRISPATRAILAPHFFGRVQDLSALRDLCTTTKIVLIEDCAHALTGSGQGPEVGESGDYVIASPRKFAPVGEGGFLAGRRLQDISLNVERPPFKRNLRILFDISDHSVAAGGLPALRGPISFLKRLKRTTPRTSAAVSAKQPLQDQPDNQLAKELLVPRGASAITRFLLERWDLDRAAAARRGNYRRLADAITASNQYGVLESDLPLSRAPYMLPVLLSDPVAQFSAIKQGPVPVWRWEHSQRGVCKVTDLYADALIQVPCHQSLEDDDISRIGDFFRGDLR